MIIRPVRKLTQPCAVNNTFFSLWEGQKWGFFAKDRRCRAFLHNKLFFLIAPRDLRYYQASAQPCAVNNTFLASGKAKNGFFSLRIADIALFYTINFFSDSPEGFALLLGQCAALRSLAQLRTPFLASWKAKNGVFSLRIAHIAPSLYFCTKGIFFGWSQRD